MALLRREDEAEEVLGLRAHKDALDALVFLRDDGRMVGESFVVVDLLVRGEW